MPEAHKERKEHAPKHAEIEQEPVKAAKVSNPLPVWQIISVALVIVIAGSVLTHGFSFSGAATATQLTPDQAKNKALNYINGLLADQATVTATSVNETNGLYNVKFDVGGQEFDSYITKDGSLLFPSAYAVPSNVSTTAAAITGTPSATYTKSDRPSVELFVMAFCPYGVQAEQAMKPVVDLLGDSADIKVKFIVNIGGTTPDDVQSLHGSDEAYEDLRQVCIRQNYNQSAYWNYVSEIGDNCYSVYRNATQMDSCWKAAAIKSGINVTQVESCYNASSIVLLAQDETASNAYGVTGSPTLIINGKTYSGARTSDAFKAAICSAFTTAPAACGGNLSSTETAAQGDCG